jgi:GNAT superfamily N-acetyltransferase
MIYRLATLEDLNNVWDKDIHNNQNDSRYIRWKKEYIDYNLNDEAKTFVAVNGNEVIAQITLILKTNVKAVINKEKLCDGKSICNMNAFRCDKEYEGKGHISKLVKLAEKYAKDIGYTYITIGSEARETRNLSIYFHFGYNEFLMSEIDDSEEDSPLVLYYGKSL